MMILKKFTYLLLFLLTLSAMAQEDGDNDVNQEFEIELEAEYRLFTKEGQFSGQKDNFPSFAIRPEYSVDWNKGNESINIEGFFRMDAKN